ncbi:ectoine/hydroxyectoine ABC transporter substrate-binding protein EhuB [Stappia indica]|jgi:polar amino acid transport system substrate-binding protein|uniref:Ectoine/hydroxyectoine ABC transporter substrate-binding protein EhuB n=1 Tax=Stappia indica TaxID=538381 RepID=A0A857CC52_9HYPH|nr:ectoine/hydroxyectoine ABC transporter substrate-binding protein EhuB [Stappia indica]QGZ36606.1 ectoine/hydroxyectoine ABC transporter substrate-binding protein EhuB [Stappia indica]
MKNTIFKGLATLGMAALAFGFAGSANAQSLLERAEKGEPIRIGFANEVPFAYPGEDGSPKGFVNAYTIGVLKTMGFENIEPVQTEWGGLIPGLNANRFDIVTGGMNILASRCENIAFSEPMAKVGDGFILAPGNPKNISDYASLVANNAVMVTGAGYSNIEAAKGAGVPESNIMQVPGPTEILAAVRAGRADAGAGTYFTMKQLADSSNGAVEASDPNAMPEDSFNWAGIGFRKADQAFLDKFNEAQAKYLGSEEMLAAVAEYGYGEGSLPGDKTTEWVCANR